MMTGMPLGRMYRTGWVAAGGGTGAGRFVLHPEQRIVTSTARPILVNRGISPPRLSHGARGHVCLRSFICRLLATRPESETDKNARPAPGQIAVGAGGPGGGISASSHSRRGAQS